MRNEIYTQVQRGKRIAYTRYHVGCDALAEFAAQMTDYDEEERRKTQEIIAYTADACDDLVKRGGIVARSRIVRRGIQALDLPYQVRAQFVEGPIAKIIYDQFKFPVSTGMKLHLMGYDDVFVLARFPDNLIIQADGYKALQLLTPNGKPVNNWRSLSEMMNKAVGKFYNIRDCSTLVSRTAIVDNAFADAVVANR